MCQLDRQLLQQINTNKTIKDIFLICRSIYSFWSAESELPGRNPRKVLMKNFVCSSERDPASPPQQPAILTVAGLAARRTDLFGVRSELFQVDGAVNVRGCHSLFGRSGNPKPYRSVLQRDFPAAGEIPGTSRKG